VKTHRLRRWSCPDGYAVRKARRMRQKESKEIICVKRTVEITQNMNVKKNGD